MHARFAVHPGGGGFANRLWSSVGIPRIATAAGYTCRMTYTGRHIVLGPDYHVGLQF